ncbi:hypothetical protein V1527DRAFT_475689 [Lipomyces starkeyi]
MTVSVWTFLTTPYLTFAPMYLSAPICHKLVLFAIELLTNVFWFTGFIVLLAVYKNFYNGDLMNEAPAGGSCGEPIPPAYDGPANMPECDGMSDAKPCHGLSSTSGYNATSSE